MERLSDYDFELPDERIAQTPLADRSSSKLLHLDPATGVIRDLIFRDVAKLLRPGDLLVMNETRVTALRLFGQRASGGQVEALLLTELEPFVFEALMRPGKRLKPGSVVTFEGSLRGVVEEDLQDGLKRLRLDPVPREELLRVGRLPLPPYIHTSLADSEAYQTVYAARGGSAAAPTAGLHFTPELLAELAAKGVETAKVSLDVSIDTFRPIPVEDLDEHKMHGETCRVAEETVRKIENCQGRIVAVGTTTVRTLESFAIGKRQVRSGEMVSKLFIRPGYPFQIVDGMFTNFHLPKTSMLLMISALATRENVLNAYAHALACGYRFLSFGDSMLILTT